MSKQKKKRDKKYVPRRVGAIPLRCLPHKVALIMEPFDSLLRELRVHGTVSVNKRNVCVFEDAIFGEVYPLVPAARGFLLSFAIWSRRTGNPIDLTGVEQLLARLEYGAPVTELELSAAERGVDAMRQALYRMTNKEASELVNDASIRMEFEKQGVLDEEGRPASVTA